MLNKPCCDSEVNNGIALNLHCLVNTVQCKAMVYFSLCGPSEVMKVRECSSTTTDRNPLFHLLVCLSKAQKCY